MYALIESKEKLNSIQAEWESINSMANTKWEKSNFGSKLKNIFICYKEHTHTHIHTKKIIMKTNRNKRTQSVWTAKRMR